MENEIVNSWKKNAQEWVKVIDNNLIESRQFTNKAMVEVLQKTRSRKIIDIGCGEGWLTRSITEMGKKAVGIDAIESLLINARSKGPESFYRISYEEIIEGTQLPGSPHDIAVFNFCLYQKDKLKELLTNVRKSLKNDGSIVVQTLHPYFIFKNGLEYKSQMISDSWNGLPGNFTDGHKWYVRTLEDWVSVFSRSGMKVLEIKEIVGSEKQPISLLIRAS